MYMVANTSSKKVTIRDLNLVVSRKQVIDLHRLRLKIDPLDSTDLKNAIREGKIKELNRPGKRAKPQPPAPKSTKSDDNDALLKQIRQLIRQEMGKPAPSQPQQPQAIPAVASDELLDALSEINSEIRSIKEQKLDIRLDANNAEEPDGLDEDTLTEIHARAMEKVAANRAKGLVTYKEEDVEDDSVIDHVSELEGLQ